MTRHSNEESSLAPAKLTLTNCQTTPSRSDLVSLAGSPLYTGLPNCQTNSQGPQNSLNEPDKLLRDACDLHHRVIAGMDYLRAHLDDRDRFERGRTRLVSLVAKEYAPLLAELIAGSDPDALIAQRDELAARLDRGMTVDKPGADDLFADLLTRYSVLCDALAGNQVVTIMDRIERLEVVAV